MRQDRFPVGLSYHILFILELRHFICVLYHYFSHIKSLWLYKSFFFWYFDKKDYITGGGTNKSEEIPLMPRVICNICRGEVDVCVC